MADVRALLKAKRQEIKITHPLASYTSLGQLRCSACGTPVKHASAWEGHIGSKAHRMNVARIKEEERRQQEEAEREAHAAAEAAKQMPVESTNGKRKATTEDDIDEDDPNMEVDSTNDNANAKRRRVGPAPGGFPADFFSDPSRAPIPTTFDSDDDDDQDMPPQEPTPNANAPPPPSTEPRTAVDLEYERFQREMALLGSDPTAAQSDKRETYERATVIAEPELVEIDETPGGFPAQDQQMDGEAEKEKQGEEERERRRREQEERELIMDRLMDEERAQEEADQRVSSIRAKFEALKKKRGARKVQESAS